MNFTAHVTGAQPQDDDDLSFRIYPKRGSPEAFLKPARFHPAISTEQLPDISACTLRTPIYKRDIPNKQQIWMKWKERGRISRSKSLKPLKGIQKGHPSEQVEQQVNPVSDTELSLEPEFWPQHEVQGHLKQHTDDKGGEGIDKVLVNHEIVAAEQKQPPQYDTESGLTVKYATTEPEDDGADGALHHILRLRGALGWDTELQSYRPSLKKSTNQNIQIKQFQSGTRRKEDSGDFLYCLSRTRDDPRARYNPYDLQVVSASKAKSCEMYWTISASYVSKITSVTEKGGIETIPIMDWLIERRHFYRIYQLPVFVKFRSWKAFNVWKVNVRNLKTSNSRLILLKQLFFADEIFLRCLCYIRDLCEAASCSNGGLGIGENAISFVKLDRTSSYSCEQFAEIQSEQREYALEQLFDLRYKIIQMVKESCLQKAEMEGVGKVFTTEPDNSSERPAFTEIVASRPLLAHFIKFLKLVDYLFQELLCRLVKTAVQLLLDALTASYMVTSTDERRNEELLSALPLHTRAYLDKRLRITQSDSKAATKDPPSSDTTENKPEEPTNNAGIDIDQILKDIKEETQKQKMAPIFIVNLILDIPSKHEIAPRDSTKYKCRAYNEVCRFDQSRMSSKQSQTSQESQKKLDCTVMETIAFTESDIDIPEEEDDGSQYKKSARFTLSLTSDDLLMQIQNIVEVLEQTVGNLVAFVDEPRLSMFNSQSVYELKLSSDQELEERRSKQKKLSLNPDILFGQDPLYQNQLAELQNFASVAMVDVREYSRTFERYCAMVDLAMGLDIEASIKQQEWTPQDFRSMLQVYTEHVMEMNNMTVERRVRMMKVLSRQYQADCLPYSEAVVNAIRARMKSIAYQKNIELLDGIAEARRRLDKEVETVDIFGEHLMFLSQIETQMPMLDREFENVTQLYAIANEYGVPILPEELALYQMLVPSFKNLKSSVLYSKAMKERNIIKFRAGLEDDINNLYFELLQVKYKVRDPMLLQARTALPAALEAINALTLEISTIASKARNYSHYQDRFCSSGESMSSVVSQKESMLKKCGGKSSQALNTLLSETEYDLMLRKLLWESRGEWETLYTSWTDALFNELNVDTIQKDVNRLAQTTYMLEKGLPANDIVPLQKQAVLDFKETLPVIVALRNPWLLPKHWNDIEYTIGRSIKDKNLTLGNLTKLRIFQRKDAVINISAFATNEATLQNMLEKVITLWNQTNFRLVSQHVDTFTVLVIGSTEEIISQLEESLITISNIKGSRYVEPIKKELSNWERKLNLVENTIDEWMICQRNWLYLKPIFHAPDIQRQLTTEAKVFAQIEMTWNELIMRIQNNPNIVKTATTPGVLELLQTTNAKLENILKCLEDYLEAKRIAFPRFYFLSNNELLDVLSQSKNPDAIRPHLAKCFENIRSLEIHRHATISPIVVMIKSAENENLPLPRSVRVRGSIEQWLGNVESAMFEAVKTHLQMGITDWESTPFKKWVLSHPGQVVLTVNQIMFNRDCMNCFNGTNPHSELQDVRLKLMNRLDGLAELVSGHLRASQETVLETLLIINVHCRDVLSDLIAKNIIKANDFEWTRQLRYEWNMQNNTCYVVQAKSSFTYGYEYLGCSPRLVITPLTDRCWLTLTGALHLNLGGSPAGPTGTGKTATVKDLAKALGKHCVVFNCSEGLDYKMMGKLFSGMAQSGAWFCFDEFNRIDVEVLSVTASQILSIKAAKDSEAMRFVFVGREIRLNRSCGLFATMNPGYEGRVDLPDNLKSLFRPVAMMVPDCELIAEIILFSEGFKSAKSLSGKIVDLYQLASKQLSQQDHYDFGMRSIKSVLVMAGQKKRAAVIKNTKKPLSQTDESHILINAVKDANLPKFLAEDVPLFGNILADLFPGLTPPKEETVRLQVMSRQ
uniref:dynein axonemal heavy chain 6-like n=1 Tax=Pristiophorus japonicus TaxID=55135 RepID=UPI00398F3748